MGVAVNGEKTVASSARRSVAPDVYDAYLKVLFALDKRGRAGLEEALQHLEVGVDTDGTFAPAYAGLAATYSALGLVFYGEPPGETRPKVLVAARKALELDPELAEARALLANALQKNWQWAEAEAEYRRAIDLSPSDAAAHSGLADWLLCQGPTDEGLASARRGQGLDPAGFDGPQAGWILFQAPPYEEAIRELRTALTMEPK